MTQESRDFKLFVNFESHKSVLKNLNFVDLLKNHYFFSYSLEKLRGKIFSLSFSNRKPA